MSLANVTVSFGVVRLVRTGLIDKIRVSYKAESAEKLPSTNVFRVVVEVESAAKLPSTNVFRAAVEVESAEKLVSTTPIEVESAAKLPSTNVFRAVVEVESAEKLPSTNVVSAEVQLERADILYAAPPYDSKTSVDGASNLVAVEAFPLISPVLFPVPPIDISNGALSKSLLRKSVLDIKTALLD